MAGLVRRVLVNAYVRSDVPDSIELRAQCLALVCGPHAVVVHRTAAWLWGIDLRKDCDAPALSVLDAFVREHGLTLHQLQAELVRHRGRRGVVQARARGAGRPALGVVGRVDHPPRATHAAGLPPPVPQF